MTPWRQPENRELAPRVEEHRRPIFLRSRRWNCARAGQGLRDGLFMNPLTRYIVVSFLFATAGLLAVPVNAQDIVVGEFASLTGSEATFGVNSSNGVELAKEEINN